MGRMDLLDQIKERYAKPDIVRRSFALREDEDNPSTSLEPSGETGKFRGLAVPFNSVTRIDDFFDGPFDEQFLPGAFTETLAEKRVTLLFEHGRSPVFDRMPVGSFDKLEETERGLEFEATPFTSPIFDPIREAVAAGVIDQMSIGFRAQDFDIVEQDDEENVPLVSHSRVELPEMSIVLWAAYEDTELSLNSVQSGPAAPTGPAAKLTRGENRNTEQPTRRPRLALARARLTLEELT